MDMINISKIINDKNVKKSLPTQCTKTEQISTVYTLTKTIRSKIFNHTEFIKTLDTKDILKNMNKLPGNCITSPCYRCKPWASCKWRYTYCPKQQTKLTAMQGSQIQGTSLH